MTTDGFVTVPAGIFRMGADESPHPEDGEGPTREVDLSAFRIARTTVANAEFAAFVAETGHITEAEQRGGSFVFQGQLADPDAHPAPVSATPWWRWVEGASWKNPTGAVGYEDDFPVVHTSRSDAVAYCEWASGRLPTEAEWECAASAPCEEAPHIWKGRFPTDPAEPPGPIPVAQGAPNAIGVHNMCGNVWEWTADRFTRLHSPRRSTNPRGPLNGDSYVVKGGSFLCCPSYCARFRPTSRRAEIPTATASNLGFRVAM